jgi:hypothetical protein
MNTCCYYGPEAAIKGKQPLAHATSAAAAAGSKTPPLAAADAAATASQATTQAAYVTGPPSALGKLATANKKRAGIVTNPTLFATRTSFPPQFSPTNSPIDELEETLVLIISAELLLNLPFMHRTKHLKQSTPPLFFYAIKKRR